MMQDLTIDQIFTGLTALTTVGLLVFTIGLLMVTIMQLRNAKQQRKNELFDLRYKFYKNVRSWWVSTWDTSRVAPPEWDDVLPTAMEAEFLFGKDIADHINPLAGRRNEGHPDFPDEDFIKPFRKYLELK